MIKYILFCTFSDAGLRVLSSMNLLSLSLSVIVSAALCASSAPADCWTSSAGLRLSISPQQVVLSVSWGPRLVTQLSSVHLGCELAGAWAWCHAGWWAKRSCLFYIFFFTNHGNLTWFFPLLFKLLFLIPLRIFNSQLFSPTRNISIAWAMSGELFHY